MPTISIQRDDFQQLLGEVGQVKPEVQQEQLETWLTLVKGELKSHNSETGEWRIELQDSNRPDLWCCEGIARQIRTKLQARPSPYPFFSSAQRPSRRLAVSAGLDHVRPYVAACAAVGHEVTHDGLAQLIQTQEKLADIFGRKRRTVSIGLYRLPSIQFPVSYDLVRLEDASFTPLGMDTAMTLGEILMVHPKGLEYGTILAGQERVPLLRDAAGRVLSFPPIINSREIGEVRVGDRDLFVEVTGTDLRMVVLTLNILAANLADRGASIEPVEVLYPYKTELGATLCTPMDFGESRSIPVSTIQTALGQPMGAEDIGAALRAYGYEVAPSREEVSVKLPPYRNDLLHAVDVVEDVAISRGYGEFAPVMPSQFTVGALSRAEEVSDRVRDLMIGMGFQEVISNIMGSRQDLCGKMRLPGSEWDRLVEVDNIMSQSFTCLRQWMTPSLLRVEAASSRAFYPHRLFEVGGVVTPDETQAVGARTFLILGALIAHAGANFSEIHSCLDWLLFYIDCAYTLEPLRHPSFLDGRAGRIASGGQHLGIVGELHPEVLENWQVGNPAVIFELDLSQIR
ncbi:MAG: phenylalanine--tRNA ligase subunit beta [Nitrospiraceae bacterium]